MTPWMEYNNGALNFNYRRRLAENASDDEQQQPDISFTDYQRLRASAHAAQVKHAAINVRRGAARRRKDGVQGGGAIDAHDEQYYSAREFVDDSLANVSRAATSRRGRQLNRRELLSSKLGDWRERMVFFPGDERETFYAGQTGRMCPPDAAIYDPACRVSRRTHREVAYNSYGMYTKDCILNSNFNAWVCKKEALIPARLIIESMDADFAFDVMKSDDSHAANHVRMRFITPATLATDGYVDFLNGGWWLHGGFTTTVAINRTYDFAMASTNPKTMRFALPNAIGHHYDYSSRWDLTGKFMPLDTDFHRKAQEARVVISLFYSNPEKLEIYMSEPKPKVEKKCKCTEGWPYGSNCQRFATEFERANMPAIPDPTGEFGDGRSYESREDYCRSNFDASQGKLQNPQWHERCWYWTVQIPPTCWNRTWWEPVRRIVPRLEAHLPAFNQFNFTAKKPQITDPCGSNMFAAWENKFYFLVCGGWSWVMVRQVPIIVLSLGFEVATEDFFDPHYLTRNLASLFGIPQNRMRVPKIVPGSQIVDVEIEKIDACADVATCGAHGSCHEGVCVCDDGWMTPAECQGGDCECTYQVNCAASCATCEDNQPTQCKTCKLVGELRIFDVAASNCVSVCPTGSYLDHASQQCRLCDSTCAECSGPSGADCTRCLTVKSSHNYFMGGGKGGSGECVSHCPLDGFYLEPTNRTCLPCHDSCRQCRGPRATECTACSPNPCVLAGKCPPSITAILDEMSFWTTYRQVPHITGSCVSTCPAGRAPRYNPLGQFWKEVPWDEAEKPGILNTADGNVVEIRGGWANKSRLDGYGEERYTDFGHGRKDNLYPVNIKKRLHNARQGAYQAEGVLTVSWRMHRAMHGPVPLESLGEWRPSGDRWCYWHGPLGSAGTPIGKPLWNGWGSVSQYHFDASGYYHERTVNGSTYLETTAKNLPRTSREYCRTVSFKPGDAGLLDEDFALKDGPHLDHQAFITERFRTNRTFGNQFYSAAYETGKTVSLVAWEKQQLYPGYEITWATCTEGESYETIWLPAEILPALCKNAMCTEKHSTKSKWDSVNAYCTQRLDSFGNELCGLDSSGDTICGFIREKRIHMLYRSRKSIGAEGHYANANPLGVLPMRDPSSQPSLLPWPLTAGNAFDLNLTFRRRRGPQLSPRRAARRRLREGAQALREVRRQTEALALGY